MKDKTKFIMMCGLPASGKSTHAKVLARVEDAVIHSSDEIRKELFGDESVQTDNSKVFEVLHKRVKEDLKNGESVIYDATNIAYKRRMAFLREIDRIDVEKICYFVATSYENCLRNDKLRDRKVGEEVIKRMYKNFWIPQLYEGWDDIKILWDYKPEDYILKERLLALVDYEQDSPHHSLTLDKHLNRTRNSLILTIIKKFWFKDASVLIFSAKLHDIGKPFTREFNKEKGHSTYYQHHLVGGYQSLFLAREKFNYSDKFALEVAKYVQWHMYPYSIQQESTKNKMVKLVGENFFNKLMALHTADKKAH